MHVTKIIFAYFAKVFNYITLFNPPLTYIYYILYKIIFLSTYSFIILLYYIFFIRSSKQNL